MTILEMVERVTAAERAGREVVAAVGLARLREIFESGDFLLDEQTWPEFVNAHFPFGLDRASQLIGRMVYRGGLLQCPKCFALTTCHCGCGVPYVHEHRWAARTVATSALDRAAAALAAHPEKSNRAIAAEIGVSFETVRKARKRQARVVA